MTDRYCLRDGRLQQAFEDSVVGQKPTAMFHLTADGALREVMETPLLEENEGVLMYTGNFYVEPLEIQIEFLKNDSARKWLEALVLRHTDRVRQIEDNLWVFAEIREVSL